MELYYTVKQNDADIKLKYILKNKMYISNILLKKLKEENSIFVNDKVQYVNYKVKEKDKIKVLLPNSTKKFSDKFITKNENLNILFEDDYIFIVNKPSNMPVHPSCDNYENTLSNIVAYYFESKGINGIHILTRLDKNTSGICIFAKNEYIQELFLRKKDEINLLKEYIAITNGIINCNHDIIEKPIARKKGTIILREVNDNGDYAKTEYFVVKTNIEMNYTVIKVLLHTGRTHQIRVHMSYLGHTLLGDDLYANNKEKEIISNYISRQALHCYKISFTHPITSEYIEIICNIPDDMQKLCNT